MAWRHFKATKSSADRSEGSPLRLFGIGRFAVVLLVDQLVVLPVDLLFDLVVGAKFERSTGSADASAVCGLRDFQRSLRHFQFGTPISLNGRLCGRRSR
jgi:hypothetical protein